MLFFQLFFNNLSNESLNKIDSISNTYQRLYRTNSHAQHIPTNLLIFLTKLLRIQQKVLTFAQIIEYNEAIDK